MKLFHVSAPFFLKPIISLMRHHKIVAALCWVVIALLAIGIATDALVLLGLMRAWQYIFNFASIFLFIPFLLYHALRDKEE